MPITKATQNVITPNIVTTDTRQTITGEKVIQALYESTSTTSLSVSTGTKTLTIGTGLNWVAGSAVNIRRTSGIGSMNGTVTSYDPVTGVMVANITSNVGTGTYSAWTIVQNPGTSVPALRITANDSAAVFVVEDSTNPDPTPFTISASGRVGIGVTPDSTVCLALDSTGVKFDDGTVQTTATLVGATGATGIQGIQGSTGPQGATGVTALSFLNNIINGNFGINQRVYVSGTATSGANQYTLDRWRVVTSGQNLTFSASGTGNIVTAPAGGIEQVIESLNIEGGTYTLSWTGTATGAVNGSAVSNGGQVTLTANTNATIKFSSGTVSQVQLEAGSVVTPFENRLIGTELDLCQRYCLSISQDGIISRHIGSGFWVTSTNGDLFINHFVPMRATPTLSISSVSHFSVNNGGSIYILTGLSVDTNSNNLISALNFNTATGGASGNASRIYMSNASAKITLSAEF